MRLTYLRSLRIARGSLLLAGLVAGCAAREATGAQVWIDIPLDGEVVFAGREVQVVSRAFDAQGVAEMLLTVNGEPYRRDAPAEPGESFTSASQAWLPETPGGYSLMVTAYDTAGAAIGSAVVWVSVAPAATPTPTATATPVATATPTATATPPPGAQVSFSADLTSLLKGGCTMLRWQALNATAVALDGAAVEMRGARQVCPASTTTYALHVTAPAGDVDRSVTISVSAPADTAPPSIDGVSASTSELREPNCDPHTVTITAQVSDPGGVASVEVVYRVSGGSWETRTMSGSGGSYQVTLDWGALQASRDPVPTTSGSALEYYVRARDASGNSAKSGVRSIAITYCLI
ncbi:MAG: hypothetical protein NTU91_16830 [Chloroflexi bacterium]|nr:hypothetical protein [Chloroflexota bacterium]